MRISIVIPVYNVEAYIEDCLSSVAAQTYNGEIECIIVDDCTPDSSCIIIERFISKYTGNIEFKLLHHKKNRGLSAARNTGIDAATGEYIFFLDSDDEITPDCIELLSAPLKEKMYDFVIGNYEVIGDKNEIAKLLLEEGGIAGNNEIRKLYFWGKWYMMAWNKLCNIDFIRREKLFFKEDLINEDNLWSFQLACTAESMYVVNRGIYRYNVRSSSIMGNQNIERTVLAYSTITNEAYLWSKKNNLILREGVLYQILYYRNIVFKNIFINPSYNERKKLYIKCHKKIRIRTFKLYSNGFLTKKSKLRELYNYLPGILGFWYLCLCRRFYKERFLCIC